MKTSDVLNKAADLIEERGWVRGSGWPHESLPESRLCLEGGLMAALDEHFGSVNLDRFWSCPAYRAVMQYLGRDETRIDGGSEQPVEALWMWNDDLQRIGGKGQVIATLRAAALIEAVKENAGVEVSA